MQGTGMPSGRLVIEQYVKAVRMLGKENKLETLMRNIGGYPAVDWLPNHIQRHRGSAETTRQGNIRWTSN
jgi:hypothetical protein